MAKLTEERIREIAREEIVKYERENVLAVYGSLLIPPKTIKLKRAKIKRDG